MQRLLRTALAVAPAAPVAVPALSAPAARAEVCVEVFESCSTGATVWERCTEIAIIRITSENQEARPFTCLRGVTSITAELSAVGAGIESFDGLENVVTLFGDIELRSLSNLADLIVFEGLVEIGDTTLSRLPLTSLAGMGGIKRIRDGSLVISGMNGLT